MTPTSVLVSWTAWGGTQPIFYITNHRVTGNTAWIPNPLGLTQNTSQPITGLTGSTGYDVRLQGSNAAGVAFSAVFTFTTAFGGVVVSDVDVTAEWSGPFVVSRDVVVPAEFRLSTFIVATNVSVSAEWTGPTGVVRDFTVPLEFRLGTTFSRDFAVPLEWGGQPGVSRDFAVPVDIGSTPLAPPLQVQNLALSNPTTTSLLATWDDLITGPPVQGYTLEWKRSTDPVSSFLVVVPSIPEPIAPFAVSRTFAVPAEYGGHVTFSRDVDVPLEWGGAKGASRDFVAPMEFGGATVRIVDASVPVDFIGSTKNVTRDFIIPSERKTTARRDTLTGVEFRATAAPPPPTAFYIEIDLGDASTLTNGDGHVWGLANQSGGIATLDSVPQASTAPTNILVRVIATNVIWFRDASNPLLWRFWDGQADQPPGGLSDPRYTNVAPLAVTGLAATMSTTSATLTWGFGNFTTIVGGGFLIRFKRSADSFYGSDIVQPCVGPGIGQFTDAAGRVFSVNTAGRVVVNGTPDLTSSAVAQLVYRNSQYWYHNTSGVWFFKVLVTDAWATAGLTVVNKGSASTITMNNGHLLSITSDGRIQDNSVDILGGSGSAACSYDPAIDRIYGLDDGGSGWYYYAGSGSWLATADPTGAVTMGASIANLLGGTSYDFQIQPFNIAGNAPNTTITQATSGTAPATVFSDDFTTLALYNYHNPAAGQVWQPASWFGAGVDGYDASGTWVVSPFVTITTPVQPYAVSGGILSMRLDKTPAADLAAFGNDATFGGQLQTNPTFQGGPFGYWEIRCAVPKQKGSEFAVGIYDSSGQQELDIAIATDQNGFQFAKLNVWTTSPAKVLNNYFFSYNMTNPIDSSQFHTYGIDLQATTTTFYIDRVAVMQFATPPTYSNPMFWVLFYGNATDEGGGLPLQSTLPSFAQIDYVSTWPAPPFGPSILVPGAPVGLASVSTTSSSATLSWSPPTSGGALDNGVYRVATSPAAGSATIPYCTPSSGAVTDAFSNTWTIAPTGGGQPNAVMVNGVFANGWNALFVLLVGGVVYHENTSGSWYSYTPTGSSISGTSVAWGGGSSTSPLSAVVIGGLAAATTYAFSVTVSNSGGTSQPATVNALTTGAAAPTGQWMNHFAFGGSEFFLGFVDEQEYMCDNGTGHISSTGYNPFSVASSILSITASTVAASGFSNPAGQPWNSGCITSCLEINQEPKPGLFARTAGYFEMRCKVPSGGPTNGGPGFWPAFVLYPLQAADGSNPPGEIDIFEILGASTGTVRQSLHSSVSGASHEYDYTGAGDTSLAFHTFGVDVQSNFITFYVDNVQTAQQATPSDFSGNVWYINAPFSVGGPGSWSGAPTPSVNATIGVWQIDYVGVWSNHATAYPGGTLSKPAALFLDDFTALNISFNGSA